MVIHINNLVSEEEITVKSCEFIQNDNESEAKDRLCLYFEKGTNLSQILEILDDFLYTDCDITISYEKGQSDIYIDALQYVYNTDVCKVELVGDNVRWA